MSDKQPTIEIDLTAIVVILIIVCVTIYSTVEVMYECH